MSNISRLIIKHKVKDFDKWKKLFDQSETIRRIYGEISREVYRNSEDPNDVSIVFEWDSPEKVIKYAQTKELKTAMRMAGVEEDPVIYILDGALEK